MGKGLGAFLGAAGAILTVDQVTKAVVRGLMEVDQYFPGPEWPLRLHYVTNTGAAFGILQGQVAFLIFTSLIGMAAIAYYFFTRPTGQPEAVALGMMLGGAAGNLVDRLRLGEVTDFLSFPHYPSFNVADASIVMALALLVAAHMLPRRPRLPGPGRMDSEEGGD
jgi:signal peptidase II